MPWNWQPLIYPANGHLGLVQGLSSWCSITGMSLALEGLPVQIRGGSPEGAVRLGDAELGSGCGCCTVGLGLECSPKTIFAARPAAVRWQQPASTPNLANLQERSLGFLHRCAIFQSLKPLLARRAPPPADAASCPSCRPVFLASSLVCQCSSGCVVPPPQKRTHLFFFCCLLSMTILCDAQVQEQAPKTSVA